MSTATKTVNGQELSLQKSQGTDQKGELIILRPSKLAADGRTGVVAEGVFEGSVANKFDATKLDYKIRNQETNDLYIINQTKTLKDGLEAVSVGDLVQIVYNGKVAIKGGKTMHKFEVYA